MLLLVACDTPKPSDAEETGGAADTVLVTWTGFVDAVTRTPLGLDEASVDAEASGSFRYDPSVVDTAPDDVARGQYPLAGTSFALELGGLGVVGSGSAEVEVTYTEGGDHLFGFRDGDSVHEDPPTMSVDGVERPDLGVYFVVEVRDHESDALPDPFPDAGTATLLVVDDGGSLNLWLSRVE